MAFKMKGSAFKLNNVATKSALKDKRNDSTDWDATEHPSIGNKDYPMQDFYGEKLPDGSNAGSTHNERHDMGYDHKNDEWQPKNLKRNKEIDKDFKEEIEEIEYVDDVEDDVVVPNPGRLMAINTDKDGNPLPMKSPMKGKTIPAPDEITKEHNRKHDTGEWNNNHETEEDYKKRINRFKDKDKEAPTKMKSPLEQYHEDMFGEGKREKRKKYMTNKEYYKENPELKPDPKDTMFRDVDKDGNVITRTLGRIGRGLGNIRLKGGGRGGYDMGPGGRGGWRG